LACDDELHDIISAYNNKAQETFAYITHLKNIIGYIHHEFNTPLAAMMIRIHRLKKKQPTIQKPLEKMEQSIDHLGKLIVSLTNLMSLETGECVMEETHINSILRSEYTNAKLLYPTHIIHFEEKADKTQLSCAEYIKIIVRNIIENAVKYSPNGSTISLKINENSIIIKDE
jgi:signal transduction histidine kinase